MKPESAGEIIETRPTGYGLCWVVVEKDGRRVEAGGQEERDAYLRALARLRETQEARL